MVNAQPRDYLAASVADSDVPDVLTPGALDTWRARFAGDELATAEATLAEVAAELEGIAAGYPAVTAVAWRPGPRLWNLAARLRAARETLAGRRG